MRRSLARLERRLDAASIAVAPHWTRHAMTELGRALNAAPEPVRRAVEQRLRRLYRAQSKDPAWHDDAVIAILCATNEVAPTLVHQVARHLRIRLPAPAGRRQDAM